VLSQGSEKATNVVYDYAVRNVLNAPATDDDRRVATKHRIPEDLRHGYLLRNLLDDFSLGLS
jgi:hypothetical protein